MSNIIYGIVVKPGKLARRGCFKLIHLREYKNMPIMAIFRNAFSHCPDIVQSATVNQLETGDTLGEMEENSKNSKKKDTHKKSVSVQF
jgi:hypothetical protein